METGDGTVEVMDVEDVEDAMSRAAQEDGIEEVIILTSEEDFTNSDQVQYIQIQNEEGENCEIEEGAMIGTVVHYPNHQENDHAGLSPRGDCSQILQIAFNSVMNGSDGGEMNTGEIMQFEVAGVQQLSDQSDRVVQNSNDVEGTETIHETEDFNELELIEKLGEEDNESLGQEKRETVIKKHGEQNQSPSQEDLTCIICGKACTDERALKLHKTSHKEFSLPFKCAVCDEHFRKKSDLVTHVFDKHTNNSRTPYECGECNKQFSQESTWMRHKLNFHSTETDFSGPMACSICKRVFKSEEARIRHDTLVHEKVVADEVGSTIKDTTPIKVHQCPKCDLSFATAETLLRHSDAKHPSRECLYCGKLFFRKAELRQHSREVHNKERPYACYKCWRRFTNGPEAKKHLAEFHNINIVRPVGVGRQQGDMYSTNFYDKIKKTSTNDADTSAVDEYNKQKEREIVLKKKKSAAERIPEGVPDDPNSPNDLAARLRGVFTNEPHLVAKRKGPWKKTEAVPATPELSTDPPPTPYFTPPPKFTPPSPDSIAKSKAKIKISTKPTRSPAAKTKIQKQKQIAKVKVKARRRTGMSPRLDQTLVKQEDLKTDEKVAVVMLEKLPESVLEQYQRKTRSSSQTPYPSTSNLSKTNSPQVVSSTSTGRPWRNVKSIYQYQSGK